MWDITIAPALDEDTYTANITLTDIAGNTSTPLIVDFTIDFALPDAPIVSVYTNSGSTFVTNNNPPIIT